MAWDVQQRLASVTSNGQSAGFVYDAEGNRIIRREASATTAYLDGMELKAVGSTVTATRYYTADTGTIALRKTGDTTPTWLLADTQNSAQITVDGSTGAAARQRYLPYGAHRGGDTIFSTDRGYLGKTEDANTGLDQLGARYYDPAIGRFISTDPIQVLADPQQRNPYAYSGDNPTTHSDPSGLLRPCDGGCGPQSGPKPATSGSTSATPTLPLGNRTVTARNWENIIAALQKVGQIPKYRGITDRIYACNHDISTEACGFIAMETINFGNDVCKQSGITCGGPATDGLEYLLKNSDGLLFGFREGSQGFDARSRRNAQKGFKADACQVNSFVAGTRVLLANGKYKDIENVKAGDKVLAADPKTGKTRPEPVIAAFGGTSYRNLIKITITNNGKNGRRTGIIIATEHHKFWNPTKHTWTRADQLKPHNTLRTPTGKLARVLHTTSQSGHPTVHDLTIADLHTYYVEAGTTPVLVHNSGPFCGTPIGGKIGDKLGEEDFHGSEYSLDEIVEFVNGHTGDAKPGMVRPSPAQVETTLRNAGPVQIGDQNAARFDYRGVRVIVNYDLPWKSTAYFPER